MGKEKQPEQQLQEQLCQLGQLGQMGLGGLISTFLGPAAVEAAFPLLEALTKAGQDHLAKAGQDGQGQEQPRKGDNQATEEQVPAQKRPRKRRRALSQKRKSRWRPKTTLRKTQTSK